MTDHKYFEHMSLTLNDALRQSERTSEVLRNTIAIFQKSKNESYREAEIIEAAMGLFPGNLAKATRWCLSPAKFINGSTPLSMVNSEEELQIVLDSIGRLKNGIPL